MALKNYFESLVNGKCYILPLVQLEDFQANLQVIPEKNTLNKVGFSLKVFQWKFYSFHLLKPQKIESQKNGCVSVVFLKCFRSWKKCSNLQKSGHCTLLGGFTTFSRIPFFKILPVLWQSLYLKLQSNVVYRSTVAPTYYSIKCSNVRRKILPQICRSMIVESL